MKSQKIGSSVLKDIKKIMHRESSARKGDSGRVLIVGGSKQYVGALALAGVAALRSGVDWVTIAAPEKVAWAINSLSPDLVTKKLNDENLKPSHVKEVVKLAEKHDVVLIGNGIGTKSDAFVESFVKKLVAVEKKLVIDADAIKTLSLDYVKGALLTPHEYELKLLLRNSNNNYINKNKVMEKKLYEIQKIVSDNVILLKGETDYIVSNDAIRSNATGNPGMAKAGTGDVLAGLTAGFLCQSNDFMLSACAASYVNGILGDLLLKKHSGYSFIASDLLDDIKKVLK